MKSKPKDLVEAVQILLIYEGVDEFANGDPINYHHALGRQIRNDWQLWDQTSALHQFFNSIGIHHVDDMSGIILDTLHRILNKKPVDLKGQIDRYPKYWEGPDRYMEQGRCVYPDPTR